MTKYHGWHVCPKCGDSRIKAYLPETRQHQCVACDHAYDIMDKKSEPTTPMTRGATQSNEQQDEQ